MLWHVSPMYGWDHRRVVLADLIAFAWSAPIRELVARTQISDVGLEKFLQAHGVSGPPQGHWNRVHAGRSVSELLSRTTMHGRPTHQTLKTKH